MNHDNDDYAHAYWNDLVSSLGPKLFNYFRFFFNEEEADDCVQETLIRLVEKVKAGAFDSRRAPITAFAYGIAHYIVLEQKRKKPPLAIIFDPATDMINELSDEGNSEKEKEKKELRDELKQEIKHLSKIEQEILALLIDDELSLNEIATILSLSLNTVKSHIHRAKNHLRTFMKK